MARETADVTARRGEAPADLDDGEKARAALAALDRAEAGPLVAQADSGAPKFDDAARRLAARCPDGTAALDLARRFHEAYERLAPDYGYETRKWTRSFDPGTANGALMVAVCRELLDRKEVEP